MSKEPWEKEFEKMLSEPHSYEDTLPMSESKVKSFIRNLLKEKDEIIERRQ